MKLELKHLAAYLPYGLKLKNKQGEIGTLSELNVGRDEPITMYDVVFSYSDFENIKPILRPLSDLAKEITVSGETFVPYDVIEARFPESKYPCVVMDNGIVEMSFWNEYQKLLEWHFDIFELIPAGLAIDINTLNE